MPRDNDSQPLSTEETELLQRLAERVVALRMSAPAILFLESVRPLGFLGSQAMVFFSPLVQAFFGAHRYETVRRILERREGIAALITLIEDRVEKDSAAPGT